MEAKKKPAAKVEPAHDASAETRAAPADGAASRKLGLGASAAAVGAAKKKVKLPGVRYCCHCPTSPAASQARIMVKLLTSEYDNWQEWPTVRQRGNGRSLTFPRTQRSGGLVRLSVALSA